MAKIKKYYSQADQDRWVVEQVFNYKTAGYFLDIGAFDGVRLSNTFYLERNLGWTGLCLEADPGTFPALKANRKCKCLNACVGLPGQNVEFASGLGPFSGSRKMSEEDATAGGAKMDVTTVSLAGILKEHNAPRVIDYISLDVEGMEYDVMQTFPFEEHRFLCATIERPGAALRDLLKDRGYLLVADTPGMDAFYLHPDMAGSYTWRTMNRSALAALSLPGRLSTGLLLLFRHGFRHWSRRL
jgi:FkbM family methyltransferase